MRLLSKPVVAALVIISMGMFSSGISEELNLKKGLMLLNDGRIDEALSIFHEELDKNPENVQLHIALGVSYVEKGDYNTARIRLEEALALNPESLAAYYTLAMLYEKERNFHKAAEEWKNVLRLSKDKDVRELARKHLRQLQ